MILSKTSLPVVHVDDYGAVGDGVTDDKVAIQAAIDAVGQGTVFFGNKNYFCGTLLISGQVTLEGCNKSGLSTKLTMNTADVTGGTWIEFSGGTSGGLSNMYLDFNGGVSSTSGVLANHDGISIRDCTFTNTNSITSFFGISNSLSITNLSIRNCVFSGMLGTGTRGISLETTNLKTNISDVSADTCYVGFRFSNMYQGQVRNAYSANAAYNGIEIYGGSLSEFYGMKAENTAEAGVLVESTGSAFVDASAISAGTSGVYFSNVANCTARVLSSSCAVGLTVAGDGTNLVIDASVASNTIPLDNQSSPIAEVRLSTSSLYHIVEEFGAVGDGSTDDTSAITSAITAAASSGKPVLLGPKTYLVSNLTLGSYGVKLKGTNSDWSQLKGNTGSVMVTLAANYTSLENLFLDGDGLATVGVSIAGGVVGAHCLDVWVTGCTSHGLETTSGLATDFEFTDCLAYSNGGNGFNIDDGLGGRLLDCSSEFNTGHGLYMTSCDKMNIDAFQCQHNTLDGVNMSGCTSVRFDSPNSRDNDGAGYYLDNCSTCSLLDASAHGNSYTSPGSRAGFEVVNGGTGNVITGLSTGAAQTYGLTEDASTYTDCTYTLYAAGNLTGNFSYDAGSGSVFNDEARARASRAFVMVEEFGADSSDPDFDNSVPINAAIQYAYDNDIPEVRLLPCVTAEQYYIQNMIVMKAGVALASMFSDNNGAQIFALVEKGYTDLKVFDVEGAHGCSLKWIYVNTNVDDITCIHGGTAVSDMKVENFYFQNTIVGGTTSQGVYADVFTFCHFKNCTFTNSNQTPGVAVAMVGAQACIFEAVEVNKFQKGFYLYAGCDKLFLRNCLVSEATLHSFHLNGIQSSTFLNCRGSTSGDADWRFENINQLCSFIGCQSWHSDKEAWKMDAGAIDLSSVVGFIAYNPSQAGVGSHPAMSGAAVRTSFTGTIVAPDASYGFEVTGGGGYFGVSYNFSFYSKPNTNYYNIDLESEPSIVGLDAPGLRQHIDPNDSIVLASAAEITPIFKAHTVSGTTNINSILSTNAKNFDELVLLFDNILTVGHSAGTGTDILLHGSADFVTSANDMLVLVWAPVYNAWVEKSRTVTTL